MTLRRMFDRMRSKNRATQRINAWKRRVAVVHALAKAGRAMQPVELAKQFGHPDPTFVQLIWQDLMELRIMGVVEANDSSFPRHTTRFHLTANHVTKLFYWGAYGN